jgi:hypothetical protein
MIWLLRSGSYDRYPIGVSCPFASMVLEFVAVSLAKPVFLSWLSRLGDYS